MYRFHFPSRLPALAAILLGAGCGLPARGNRAGDLAADPHSYSRPGEVRVHELELALRVDFDRKTLSGSARWKIERPTGGQELWLDTRDLRIHRVERAAGGEAAPARFALGAPDPLLGRSLRIELDEGTEEVIVHYETAPGAAALQWLEPGQTAGGRHPFLFTQSQAILARTWLPCQDSPGVRFTFRAAIEADEDLTAVMSAERAGALPGSNGRRIWRFRMPQPIPSYLVALAAGELEFRELGPRTGVYAEPPVAGTAAWEFADTEAMVEACERLFGPYRWGRYDILVLPPSFPFGGMENPRLTFATPTILAGDRSLVALIAHELAHSWSGNLVTNATWNDFWLNEGFTVYLEHRIMEEVYGKAVDDMLVQLGADELQETIARLSSGEEARPRDTWLKLDLRGRDPDEALTDIAYEKGYLFLRRCEEVVGRETWDAFLRRYFDRFAFQSMTTEGFIEHLREELGAGGAGIEALRIDEWVYGSGLPEGAPAVRSRDLAKVEAAAAAFGEGAPPEALETSDWSALQWLHFVRKLPRPLGPERLAALEEAWGFTRTGNSEILCEWFLVAISSSYEPAFGALEEFLKRVGRRKFLEPLYKALAATPEGRELARSVYRDARSGYHSIARATIDGVLGWGE